MLLASLVVAWFVTAGADDVHDDKIDTTAIMESSLGEVPVVE